MTHTAPVPRPQPGETRPRRIAGVPVGLHWSLPVMVALVAGGLAQNRFSYDAPGHSTTTYVIAGVLTALGLILGVFVHELAHAVVARLRGQVVEGITLTWMGGLTRIRDEHQTPTSELLVAGAGPVASAALGGVLWLVRIGASAAGADALILAAVGWLAWINVVLAIFNVLPAAPLDGGRLVHAVVWLLGHDRWKATRVAAGAGMAMGALIIVGGFFSVSRSNDLVDGLIFGFIGWWMIGSARMELDAASTRRHLAGVLVSEVMRPVSEGPGWLSVRAFVDQFATARPGWVWLLRDWNGGYGGLLLGDSLGRVPYHQWDVARPLDVALPLSSAVPARPGEEVLDVLARAEGHPVILVTTDHQTLGAVLVADVEALIKAGGRAPAARSRRWAHSD